MAVTLETVRFSPPGRIDFRLVRGPVPQVRESFRLEEEGGATLFTYEGELGTDFWAVGRAWGALVARRWEAVVAETMEAVRAEAERRAPLAEARGAQGRGDPEKPGHDPGSRTPEAGPAGGKVAVEAPRRGTSGENRPEASLAARLAAGLPLRRSLLG